MKFVELGRWDRFLEEIVKFHSVEVYDDLWTNNWKEVEGNSHWQI
jgi:hypothetical protein